MAEQLKDPGVEKTKTDYIVRVGGNRLLEVPEEAQESNPLRLRNRLSWASWKLVVRRVVIEFFAGAMMDRGAVLTFFMLLTSAPTVLAAYSIATLVLANNEDQVRALTNELIVDYVPDEVAGAVRDAVGTIIGSSSQGTIALVLGVLTALLASSAYVRAFARNANALYGRVEGRRVVRTWLIMWGITLLMVVGGVLIMGALLLNRPIVETFLQPIAEPLGLTGVVEFLLGIFLPVWQWVRFPVVILIAVVLIANLYHFAPNVKTKRFRWLTVGSVTALIGIGGVWVLFSWYISNFAANSAYGAISTVLALLIALWVVNIVLVIGVKIDAEVLRAKELQIGLDSERDIQVPPRSSSAAVQYAKIEQGHEAIGRQIKDTARAKSEEALAEA